MKELRRFAAQRSARDGLEELGHVTIGLDVSPGDWLADVPAPIAKIIEDVVLGHWRYCKAKRPRVVLKRLNGPSPPQP